MHLQPSLPLAQPSTSTILATGVINPCYKSTLKLASGQYWVLHLQLLRIKQIFVIFAELLLHIIYILDALSTGPVLIEDLFICYCILINIM